MTRPEPMMRERRPELLRRADRSTTVLYPEASPPIQAAEWDGWPVAWDLPNMSRLGFGYASEDIDGYMTRVSTVMTCADLNSRQLGSMPTYGVHSETGVRFSLPSWADNPEPDLYASWSEFMKTAVNSYLLAGETFLWATARNSAGFPARFVVLNPSLVNVEHEGGRFRYRLGEHVDLDPADVCHIRYQNLPGSTRGVGPMSWAGRSLASAEALELYGKNIAEHGVWAVLRHPSNLNRSQAQDLKASWQSARASDPSAPAVLSGGVEFDVLSLSPTDMALLDLRVFDEQRIAAAFGIPPFLIGLPNPGGMTYSTTTQLFEFHWKATLRPLAQAFASAMSAWLLPHRRMLEFNRDEYVRPGLGERAQAYSVLHSIQETDGSPAVTVDEIRRAERLAPYEHDHPEKRTIQETSV